ncbi:class I SAM-dependent methyltransferase [Gordonia humi]|uniref:SAM-dependent methyltransferase n=1 Tax=Gordonia humi TaxID=686429 RepID=A0A840EU45_9ACTN|nr:SAM-dependent methyltransferase [Gordonia humi]
MTDVQPGYDAMAAEYARVLPDPFQTPLERGAVDAFAAHVRAADLGPTIVDVGCGTGHIAAHLTTAGFSVTAVDPSAGMLDQARLAYRDLSFTRDDASLGSVDLGAAAGVIARYSLIHVAPEQVRETLRDWAARLRSGSVVLLAGQSTDESGTAPFDHAVAPAWRWHPDEVVRALSDAGFAELWRTVSRPSDGYGRFPEFHVCARR